MTSHRRPQANALIPYLVLDGAAACIEFCQEVIGMKLEVMNCDERDLVLHSMLRLEDSVLEISDARDGRGTHPAMLHVYVENLGERYEVAKAAGVEILMPPTVMDYGETSFGFNDHWGNQWWLATYTGGAC